MHIFPGVLLLSNFNVVITDPGTKMSVTKLQQFLTNKQIKMFDNNLS